MFVVDTNLLLYAVNPDAPEHEGARDALEEWRRGDRSWYLTWGIVYEFLRVSTHSAVFPRPLDLPAAHAWIRALLAAPRSGLLVQTDRHDEVLGQVIREHPRLRGNPVHDLHTATVMREHGDHRNPDRRHRLPSVLLPDSHQPAREITSMRRPCDEPCNANHRRTTSCSPSWTSWIRSNFPISSARGAEAIGKGKQR